ncbi:unnamed protein product, partial [Ectocarpus sp. 8 AP-2014]
VVVVAAAAAASRRGCGSHGLGLEACDRLLSLFSPGVVRPARACAFGTRFPPSSNGRSPLSSGVFKRSWYVTHTATPGKAEPACYTSLPAGRVCSFRPWVRKTKTLGHTHEERGGVERVLSCPSVGVGRGQVTAQEAKGVTREPIRPSIKDV